MKGNFCLFLIISTILILILATNHIVNGQPANSTIANIINEKCTKNYTSDPKTNTIYEEPQFIIPVHVNYESPWTILISGGLINSIGGNNTFNYQLWEAMDLLKNQYGFKLQNVMASGEGSVGNPTVVYILMTK
jgi:hypothetical protein